VKVIALLPVRNEAYILGCYLSSVGKIADQIIAFDHGSTDESVELLRSAGADVEIGQPPSLSGGRDLARQRQRLLERGRAADGTHFILLDADEAFTAPFAAAGRGRLASMDPGEKLLLRWLALWKDRSVYRDDDSVWSGAWKDFVFCDDGVSSYDAHDPFHETRTPDTTEEKRREVQLDDGAVLHFQFAAWHRFEMKQAWYKCWERVVTEKSPLEINRTYRATLDEDALRTTPVPSSWYEGIAVPDELESMDAGWYGDEILDWFDRFGASHFEPLEIWHVDALRDAFSAREGRSPRMPVRQAVVDRLWDLRVSVAHRVPAIGRLRRAAGERLRSR
jgi:glycosyltransferase involved in cell wall biosynthesis